MLLTISRAIPGPHAHLVHHSLKRLHPVMAMAEVRTAALTGLTHPPEVAW